MGEEMRAFAGGDRRPYRPAAGTLLILFVMLLLKPIGFGQAPVIDFQVVGGEEPRHAVHILLQDSTGYIWFVGAGGIQRFDGHRFKTYKAGGEGWLTRVVFCLREDANGVLWAGVKGGITRFDPVAQEWIRIPLDLRAGVFEARVREIEVGRDGDLWCRTSWELLRYRPGTGVIRRWCPTSDDLEGELPGRPTGLYQSPTGDLWLTAFRSQPSRIDSVTGEFFPLELFGFGSSAAAPEDGEIGGIGFLMDDGAGILWIGTEIGLLRHDLTAKSTRRVQGLTDGVPVPFVGENQVSSILGDDAGILWLGTSSGGLHRFDPESENDYAYRFEPHRRESLPCDRISTMIRTRSGTIFVGTFEGLCHFYPEGGGFNFYPTGGVDGASVDVGAPRSIHIDREGLLWGGTVSCDVVCIDRQRGLRHIYTPDSQDSDGGVLGKGAFLAEDDDGVMWVGTKGGGIHRFDRDSETFRTWRHDPDDPGSLVSDWIKALRFDDRGELWIGTKDGLDRYDPRADVFTHVALPPEENGDPADVYINGLYSAPDGAMWVATSSVGLYLVPGGDEGGAPELIFSGMEDKRSSQLVTGVVDDGGPTVWISTYFGLWKLDRRSGLVALELHEGVATLGMSLLADRRGRLWMPTARAGILCYDPHGGSFRTLSGGNLSGRRFYPAACARAEDGEMLFSTREGILSFYPDVVLHRSPPEVILTDVSVLGESRYVAGGGVAIPELHLDHDEDFISFSFSGLDYSDPRGLRHAYRLLGASEEWIDCGDQTHASFVNLGGGSYTFEARAGNAAGVWSESRALAHLDVAFAPWETWWFRSIALVTFLLGGAGTWRWRMAGVRKQNRLLERKVGERTADLQQTHEALITSERMATIGRVTATVSHEIRNPLGTISTSAASIRRRAGSLPEKIEAPLSRIERNVQRCARTIEGLLDFGRRSRPELRVTEIDPWLAEWLEEGEIPDGLTMELKAGSGACVELDRGWIQRCLLNLLWNARQAHGDTPTIEPRVTIESLLTKGRVEIRVRDNGPGISAEELERIFEPLYSTKSFGTGLGLPHVEQVMNQLGGAVIVESTLGEGTTVILRLPLHE
jgi:signal transduction histidine kinase/ligand-binding sensor domain-containing protein